MKPENKTFLDANEHYFITLRDAGYMKGLDGNTRSGMARVITEEFQPGYATDMWCPPCVADMVRLLYRYYYEWKERQLAAVQDDLHKRKAEMIEELLKEPEIKPEPEPKAPVQIKANFPKHHRNKHRR
jgi:hypothetical protein